jgi:hypothetical protein
MALEWPLMVLDPSTFHEMTPMAINMAGGQYLQLLLSIFLHRLQQPSIWVSYHCIFCPLRSMSSDLCMIHPR